MEPVLNAQPNLNQSIETMLMELGRIRVNLALSKIKRDEMAGQYSTADMDKRITNLEKHAVAMEDGIVKILGATTLKLGGYKI